MTPDQRPSEFDVVAEAITAEVIDYVRTHTYLGFSEPFPCDGLATAGTYPGEEGLDITRWIVLLDDGNKDSRDSKFLHKLGIDEEYIGGLRQIGSITEVVIDLAPWYFREWPEPLENPYKLE